MLRCRIAAKQVFYRAVLLRQEVFVLCFGLADLEKAHFEVALLLLQSVLCAICALFMGSFCKFLFLRNVVLFRWYIYLDSRLIPKVLAALLNVLKLLQ